MNNENFPELSKLIEKDDEEWLYLPQSFVSTESHVHNYHRELHTTQGTPQQQDKEIVEFFKKAQSNLGIHKVIGVLAVDDSRHYIAKRDHEEKYFYFAKGKKLLLLSLKNVYKKILTYRQRLDLHKLSSNPLL